MSDRLLSECPHCKLHWLLTLDLMDLCYCTKCRRVYRFRETLRQSALWETGLWLKDSALLRQSYREPLTDDDFAKESTNEGG